MKSKLYVLASVLFLLKSFNSFSQANTSLSNLASATAINHSLVAGSNNSLSLGSSTLGWRNLYLTNGIYLNGSLFFSNPLKTSIAIGNKALYLNSTAGSLIAIGDSAFYNNTTGARGTAVGSYSLFKNTTGDNNTTLGYQTLYNTTTGSSNVAEGMQALYANTSGSNNIASGAKALYANTSGYSNVALGIKALYSNTTGYQSIAIGDSTLYNNTTPYNIAIGSKALYANTSGASNIAIGITSLYSNTTGSRNTAIGIDALNFNNVGTNNTATGAFALLYNSSGTGNVATGINALLYNATGNNNTAAGTNALYYNETGYSNIAIGAAALFNNIAASNNVAVGDSVLLNNNNDNSYYDGNNNTGIGSKSLYANKKGYENVATGSTALHSNTDGYWNTATGSRSMNYNTTGSFNTAIGFSALAWNSTGNYNTSLGAHSSYTVDPAFDNNTSVGFDAQISASNVVRIGNSSVSSIGGQVGWTNFSDERIKNNIKEDVPGLVFIKMLRPVTYNFDLKKENEVAEVKNDTAKWKTKYDIEKRKFTGFIAQEVDAAARKIKYDFSGVDQTGKIWGLRYSDFVVPLVKGEQELSKQNDSLKTQNVILASKVDDLQNQINQLRAMIVSSANSNQSTVISSASLAQNIPNPFTNSTTINYSIPQASTSAYIILTNEKGVVLKQINLNTKGKGNINVDASTLSAGAYQYSLYVNNKLVDTKQMVAAK